MRADWQGFYRTVEAYNTGHTMSRNQMEAMLFWKKLNKIPDSDSVPSVAELEKFLLIFPVKPLRGTVLASRLQQDLSSQAS